MTSISIEQLQASLQFKKTELEKDLIRPNALISQCDISDVIDAAQALTTREEEHRLYQHKLEQVRQIESMIAQLDASEDIYCEQCGVSILDRLNLVPTAKNCVACQSSIEKQSTS